MYCSICGKDFDYDDDYQTIEIEGYRYNLCNECGDAFALIESKDKWKGVSNEVISANIEYVKSKLPTCSDDRVRKHVGGVVKSLLHDGKTFAEHQNSYDAYFDTTDKVSFIDNILKINNTKRKFAIVENGRYVSIHRFDELMDFSIDENGDIVTSGSFTEAAIGGLLFGVTGAIVGSAMSTKTSTQTVNNLDIVLSFKGFDARIETIRLIKQPVQKGSFEYNRIAQTCKRIASALKQIIDFSKQTETGLLEAPAERGKGVAIYAFSVADEILKFKGLLDQGIITAEEFEAQKKKLLALEY